MKNEIENELWLKEQRVNFWEKYHSIPTILDIENEGLSI